MPELIQTGAASMPWYYNVTQSVGRGGVNRRDDTRLVQYLLKKAFETSLYRPGKPSQAMVVDGVCGPITTSYIIAYQKQGNRVTPDSPTLLDCLVDHALGRGIRGSISGLIYTIAALNKTFHDHFSDIFVNPSAAPDMPVDLKMMMMNIADQAS